jgi:DNA polymerase-1
VAGEPAFRLLPDAEEARTAVAALAERGEVVGLDLETTGLDPVRHEGRLLQLAPAEGPVVIVDLFSTGGFGPMQEPLQRLRAVAHNATFDMGFLHRAGVRLTTDCTLLANHVLTGTREKLSTLAEKRLGLPLDKAEQKSDWTGELSEEQLRYAALDAKAVQRLHDVLWVELAERGCTRTYELAREAQPAVVAMHLVGMPFDAAVQRELVDRLTAQREQLEPALMEALAGRNPSSGPQLADWLAWALGDRVKDWSKTGKGQLSTTADALKKGAALLPEDKAWVILDLLLPFKVAEKQLSTYGIGLAEHIHTLTGRIHAKFNLAGAITGRMSSSGPSMQNIPRDPAFRGLFKAPEGRRFVIGDYSQMELRVAAILAGEEALLRAYAEGQDTHVKSAAMLLGKAPEEVTKAERQLAKAVNFGMLFGQGAKGLQAYAASNYGVEMTLAEAATYKEQWFAAYPAVGRWQRKTDRDAKKALSVCTPAGRERRWSRDGYKLTEAVNTPVQGGAAEMTLAALGHLMRRLDGLDAVPVAVVHDELIVEASEADAHKVAGILEASMVAGMLDVFPNASTYGLVEAHVGTSWADK